MKLLILGGTRFLGRHIAEQALGRGHTLTLLHRGRSGAGPFPQAEHRIADRDGDLAAALAGGTWDAAIDTSAYLPRQVRAAAAALAGRVGQYQLVSSISVYTASERPVTREDAPLQVLADPEVQQVNGETYGGLKALCEAAARQAFGARCLVSRPGLLVGPHDPTGRFTWWVQRLARGGEVLAPGDPAAPVQFIDARDAAAWMLHQAEAGAPGVEDGTANLSGPTSPLTMGGFLATAAATLAPVGGPTRLTWVNEAFVLDHGVAPWSDLPVWLPGESAGMHRMDLSRAIASGLRCRPLEQTLRDTAAWAAVAPSEALARPGVGLAPDRETALLAAWHGRAGRAPG